MSGEKRNNRSKKPFYIGVIVVSVVVCCVCVFSGIGGSLGSFLTDVGDTLGVNLFFSSSSETTSSVPITAVEVEVDVNSLTKAELVRVVDGDTYVLNISGTETKVRLIGVDTPESVAPSTYYKDNTEEGATVSDIVKNKMSGVEYLSVEYDVGRTDKYGRTLAYLYFPDGTMVQDWLLKNGYANVATYAPNIKYSEHFAVLAHNAMENKIGLWNGFFEE